MRHVLAAALLALPCVAHADILNTFTVSGVAFNTNSYQETGTLTINATTGLATAINLNAQGDLLNSITGQGYSNGGYSLDLEGPAGSAAFTLFAPFASDGSFDLSSQTGGTYSEFGPNELYNGSVTFLSSVNTAVPEPAPLALLATGLLALPLALRRLA